MRSGCTTTARNSDSGWRCPAPERITGLVIQNGDIYADAFGPKYDFLKKLWDDPGPASRRRIAEHVTLAGFESEFRGELPDDVADRVSPDLWTLHWALMNTPERLANLIHLLEDQPSTLDWFPKEQAYLREHQPPALIVWGPHDGYMPEESAQAYHRDLPDAPLHLLGAGTGCCRHTSARWFRWSTIQHLLEPPRRIELLTYSLRVNRSTD